MIRDWARTNQVGLLAVALFFVAILTVTSPEKFLSGSAGQAAVPTGRSETYAFDNCRFFCARTPDSGDVGSKGWFNITVKGRRDYIAGIDAGRSALVVVDMQRGSMGWSKLPGELGRVHAERAREVVIPSLVKLIRFFREKGLVIVYLMLGDHDQILPEIAPSPERIREHEEFVLVKYSSGAFASSGLDNVLREKGIATVFFVGTDTAGCVNLSMAGAYDKSYRTILVEDGCLSSRQDLHEATVKVWAYLGFVRSTDQVIRDYPWRKWIDPSLRSNDPNAQH
jgi:nicotinamidase-related amidase